VDVTEDCIRQAIEVYYADPFDPYDVERVARDCVNASAANLAKDYLQAFASEAPPTWRGGSSTWDLIAGSLIGAWLHERWEVSEPIVRLLFNDEKYWRRLISALFQGTVDEDPILSAFRPELVSLSGSLVRLDRSETEMLATIVARALDPAMEAAFMDQLAAIDADPTTIANCKDSFDVRRRR